MRLLESLLGWFRDKATSGHQRRIAARCQDRHVAADALRFFSRHQELTEALLPTPEGLGRFTRRDLPRLQAVHKSVGEHVFLRPYVGASSYGYPNWQADRWEQVQHLKTWVFNAIDRIWRRIGRHEPNVAHVTDGPPKGSQHKALDPLARNRLGEWRQAKSLHAIKPHEHVTPAGHDHPLVKLFRRPNNLDVSSEFWYELGLFLELTGNTYIWAVPSKLGLLDRTYKAAELWVLPAHWVWPRVGRNNLVECYVVRPFVGNGFSLELPREEVIHLKYKSPIHKVDGFSHLTAGAEWIDTQESVNRSRFWQFKNGSFPLGAFEIDGEMYLDLTDEELERTYGKIAARFQGEANYGRPIVTPPGIKYVPLSINPTEMAYLQTSDQLRDMIMSLWGVPKEIAGIQSAGSEIAIYGPLRQFAENALIPRLTYLAQVLTEHLASRWDKHLRVWWDDPAGEDPEQRRQDIMLRWNTVGISPNEVRLAYGEEPWPDGGWNPYSPNGLVEVPLNGPAAQPAQGAGGNPAPPDAANPGQGGSVDSRVAPPVSGASSQRPWLAAPKRMTETNGVGHGK